MFKKYLLGFLVFTAVSCKKEELTPSPPSPPPVDTETTFTNPILTSGPDPWVIKKDSFYYYTHTSGDRIRIWTTKSMAKLNAAPAVTIWNKPATGPNSENVWAPELHLIDNKWYMYYTAGSGDVNASQRLFVLENTSADPTQGTWVDKGQVKDPAADFWAIDGNVFNYNGNNYLLWSGHATETDRTQRIYIAQLQNPWTLALGRVEISTPTFSWEKIGSPVNEGPEVILNPAGKPVLIFSASGCWTDDYSMGMSILKDGGNPLTASDWVKSPDPVFTKSPDNGAYGPGHCAFFKSRDETENWILYHANSSPNQDCANFRNPRIQKFTWNSNGTPNFGTPVRVNLAITKPSGE
jgi:GH43 family beta-xylosidase